MAAQESTTRTVLPQVVAGADLDRRAVLYSRVSTLKRPGPGNAKSREFESTAYVGAGRSLASTLTLAFRVPRNAAHNLTD
jgi:hypothetical protein